MVSEGGQSGAAAPLVTFVDFDNGFAHGLASEDGEIAHFGGTLILKSDEVKSGKNSLFSSSSVAGLDHA